MARFKRNLLDRILDKVSPEPITGCWFWLGSLSEGYGKINLASRIIVPSGKISNKMGWVHRVLYELLVGPVPAGLELDHKCRVRCCVNPQHLEPVTHLVNAGRGIGQGNPALRAKTHCPQGHEYDYRNTRGNRCCKRCQSESSARSKLRKLES